MSLTASVAGPVGDVVADAAFASPPSADSAVPTSIAAISRRERPAGMNLFMPKELRRSRGGTSRLYGRPDAAISPTVGFRVGPGCRELPGGTWPDARSDRRIPL